MGARFSAPIQTGRGAHPASCTMGAGSFPGVKRPGRGADHPPSSKSRGHERVELYLYSPSGPSWPVIGRTLPLLLLLLLLYSLGYSISALRSCILVLNDNVTVPRYFPLVAGIPG